jgi:antitoxin MazE
MQVSKWGNSLAIRIPASVAEALQLKEGDEVDIRVAGTRAFDADLDRSREEALERIKALAIELPPDWKFDRDEANAR